MKTRGLILCALAAFTLLGCSSAKKDAGYDNMALIYGGNVWRTPSNWDKDRLASHVTYTDTLGKEQWLFDAFLALEIWDRGEDGSRSCSLGTGYGSHSGDREAWQHFIDWWFTPDNGFDALDQAVADAEIRLGKPSTMRKVVVSIPDPTIYVDYKDTTSSTTYWGEIDGRQMDFSKGADRVAACKWFVDEVMRRWKAAGYKHIKLEGFYCFSEELATPGDGWCYELKKWDQVYPEVSNYVHSKNLTMSWIPYFKAAGWQKWQSFGFDYAMMQPNFLWHPERTLESFQEMVHTANLSMELELDNGVMEGKKDWENVRARFFKYMDTCKGLDLYGKAELSYYLGSDSLNDLKNSQSQYDQEVYRRFCEFVIGNRQR